MRRLIGIALLLGLLGAAFAGCGDIAPLPSPSSEPSEPTIGKGPPSDNTGGVGEFDDMTPAAVPIDADVAADTDVAPDASVAPDAGAPDAATLPDAAPTE